MVREGSTYKDITALDYMPDIPILMMWKNRHPDFSENLKNARRDRAMLYHDEAVDVLRDSAGVERNDVAREKMRFDGFMKLAEKGAPQDFLPKVQDKAIGNAPTILIINTGVNRQPVTIDAGVINVEETTQSIGTGEHVTGSGSDADEAIGAEIADLGAHYTRTEEAGTSEGDEEEAKEESL